jgi:hypothetical protein
LHLNRITTKQFLPLIFFSSYNTIIIIQWERCDFIWNIVHESDDNGRSTNLVLQRLMWYKFVKYFDIYEDWFVHEETFGYHNITFCRLPYKTKHDWINTHLKKCNFNYKITWINTHFGSFQDQNNMITTLLKTKHD